MGKKKKKSRSNLSLSPSIKKDLENLEAQTPALEDRWEINRKENKKLFLESLASEDVGGVIYIASKKSGISTATVYNYMNEDKAFAEAVRATRVSVMGSVVESKLMERICGVTVAGKGGRGRDDDDQPVYTIPPSVEAIRLWLQSDLGAELGYTPNSKKKIEGELNQSFAILEVPDNGRSVKDRSGDDAAN